MTADSPAGSPASDAGVSTDETTPAQIAAVQAFYAHADFPSEWMRSDGKIEAGIIAAVEAARRVERGAVSPRQLFTEQEIQNLATADGVGPAAKLSILAFATARYLGAEANLWEADTLRIDHQSRLRSLSEENARLTAALEEIGEYSSYSINPDDAFHEAVERAHRALRVRPASPAPGETPTEDAT